MKSVTITLEELKKVIALSDLPEEHLHWLLNNSEHVEYEEGAVIMGTGETPDFMFLITEGIVSFYMNNNGTLVHYFDFGNDNATGGVRSEEHTSELQSL